PTITGVPANASYQFVSGVPAAVATSVTATDNCGVPTRSVLGTNNGGAGTPASPLIITRTFTATDAVGNIATAVQTITVVDNTAPTIAAPGNVTAFTGAGASTCSAVVTHVALGTPSASDNSGT